jgi:hypothetical protein
VSDFHILPTAEGGISLRAVSDAAHNFLAARPLQAHLVRGGCVVAREFVDEVLSAIASDGLVASRVVRGATMRRF